MRKPQPRTAPEPAPVPGARWIPLTKGKFALVDEEDYEKTITHNWYVTYNKTSINIYAATRINGKNVKMHRLIMDATDPKIQVDHKNLDSLDNRLSNLRITDKSGNEGNTTKRKNNTSGYKGVFWDKTKNKYLAQLHTKERFIHLGRYDDPIDAAKAYDKAAKEHFGEFARLNFSEDF